MTENQALSASKSRIRVLKDMTIFVEVGRCASFTQAAKALNIPLSTLARRIAALETELGIRLVERTTRNQKLTADGRAYFDRCKPIVDDAFTVYDETYSQIHGLTGAIQLGAPPDIPQDILAAIISRFLSIHPSLLVSLTTSNARTLPGDNIDLVLCLGEPAVGEMVTRRIGSIPLAIYAAPEYRTKHGVIETRQGLKSHDHLVSESCRRHVTALLRDVPPNQINLGGRLECDHFGFSAGLAKSGLGLAVIPRVVAEPFVRAGALEEVLPGWSIPDLPLHVMMTNRMLPARVRALLTSLARGLQAWFGEEEKDLPYGQSYIGAPARSLSA